MILDEIPNGALVMYTRPFLRETALGIIESHVINTYTIKPIHGSGLFSNDSCFPDIVSINRINEIIASSEKEAKELYPEYFI